MKYAVAGKDMKFIDSYTIENAEVSSLVLMERAAQSVCDELIKDCTNPREVQFIIICGRGNNGADGIAIARMLWRNELDVKVILLEMNEMVPDSEEELNALNVTDEWKYQYREAKKLGVLFECFARGSIDNYYRNTRKATTVIVDAMVGAGLKSGLKKDAKAATEEINSLTDYTLKNVNHELFKDNLFVYAVDLPSGAGYYPSVKTNKVVTFGCIKSELVLYPGSLCIINKKIKNEYITIDSNIIIKNIGFLKEAYLNVTTYGILEESDFDLLPKRNPWGNKGTFGKVFLAGGSDGMCGAAYFAAKAAYRTGAGLVKILTSKENSSVYQGLIPEAVLVIENDNYKKIIADNIKKSDITILGPGLSTDERAKITVRVAMEASKKYNKPLVIDADALNIISMEPGLKEYYYEKVIITPHLGEMSRLISKSTAEIRDNIISTAMAYANTNNITVVLKDARSIITDGKEVYINTYGNDGMAKGGSGDILTGIIAGIIGVYNNENNFSMTKLVAFANMLHGMAGDNAALSMGKASIMAGDIIDSIGKVNKL